MDHPRILLWCAVSSEGQAADDKESLPDQERMGRAFAESVQGQVVDVLMVPGHSRELVLWSDAEAVMDAYRSLRHHCEVGDFDVLWARSPDRLGRDPALIAQAESLVERRGTNREVFYADAPHALGHKSTSMRFVSSIRGVSARMEIEELVRRQRIGMRGRIKRGLVACHWPYGYTDGQPDVNADAVRFATREFLAGASYSQIARDLEAAGYDAPGNGGWWMGQVRRMLHNDTYAGRPSWGNVRREDASTHYEALWDENTWRLVVMERENRYHAPYHRRASSPFLDVAFCGRCGERMTLTTPFAGKVVYRYLVCATHRRDSSVCHRNSVRLEDAFEVLIRFLLDNLDPATYTANVGPEPGQAERDELEQVERQVDVLQERRTRLGHALASGTMGFDVYSAVDGELVADLDALTYRAQHLRELLASMPDRAAHRGELVEIATEELVLSPWKEVNAALRRLGVRMVFEDGEATQVVFL